MNRSGNSFCPCCWNEFETVGPEIHLPDCKAMIVAGAYHAARLGYVAKDEEKTLPRKDMSEEADDELKFDVRVSLFGILGMKVTVEAVIKKMREMGFVCQLSDRQVFTGSYKDPHVEFYHPKHQVLGEAYGEGREHWDEEMVYRAALAADKKLRKK